MGRQLRWILASLAISATAGAQAVNNSTSNGAATPGIGVCPPGSLNCVPGFTQQGTTPQPFSPQPGNAPANPQLASPVIPNTNTLNNPQLATPSIPSTNALNQPNALPPPPAPNVLPNTTAPGNGTSTLPGNGTSTLPAGAGLTNTPAVPNAPPPR
jgi:hypothetical protein